MLGEPQQAPSCPAHGQGLPVPRAGRGEAGARLRLGSMSNRRTFPSISQPPPQGTIHLHSIFTPLHMFPFQPRIIFYHQITVVIRWSRCDSEQSVCPPLFPPPPAAFLLPPAPPASCPEQAGWDPNVRGEDRPPLQPDPQPVADSECLGGGRLQVAIKLSGKTYRCPVVVWDPAISQRPVSAPHCSAAAP